MKTQEWYETLSNEDLLKEKKKMEERCAHWYVCNDGSYELALFNLGYEDILNELKTRR